MNRIAPGKTAAWLALLCCSMAIASQAQTLTTLIEFTDLNGAIPMGALVQGPGGSFYGVTEGGANLACYPEGCGSTFRLSSGGQLTNLHVFCSFCAEGSNPVGNLVLANNGNFYGSTTTGGSPTCGVFQGCGTIFEITPDGVFSVVHTFSFVDGAIPYAGMIQATNGKLYGTARIGGTSKAGTIFEMTLGGGFKTLHMFNVTDGSQPTAPLVQATNGNFYGTTSGGGANGAGTIYEMSPEGELTTLYSFCSQSGCADGEAPFDGLVQGKDGDLYGTTTRGNQTNDPGTVFKITLDGNLTTLHRFCTQGKCADGDLPFGGLVQASNGKFYGTTSGQGRHNGGTIFQITAEGSLTTVHNFQGNDGVTPMATLVQGADGNLYGSTPFGGTLLGTLFKFSLPLSD